MQANAQVTLRGGPDKAAAAELADKEQTILELRETNEVSWVLQAASNCCRTLVA